MKTPIFAVPGAHGGVVNLQPFSQALGNGQPFYGLQAIGLDGDAPPLDNIEAIANQNIHALRKAQAHGPYRIAGYSNGGVVAYEMARILIQQGEDIDALLLLDSMCPLVRVNDIVEEITAVCNDLMSTLGSDFRVDVSALRDVPADARCDYLYSNMTGNGFEVTKRQFETYYNIMIASEHACRTFQPQKIDKAISVVLYRATQGYSGVPDDYGWNALLLAPLRSVEVEADHLSVLYNQAIESIASDINAFLPTSAPQSSEV